MKIAVTGLGAVSGLGWGAGALFDALCARRSALVDAPAWGSRGPAAMLPGGEQRLTSELALAAAREALEGLADRAGLAVVGGTTSADMRVAEPAWQALARGEPPDPERFVWPQLCHLPTQRVAAALGAGGLRLSVSTACTSGACAVGVAADLLRTGRASAALAFGADALCDTTVHGFGSLGLYDPAPCQPMSAGRKGLNLGEGAGALLLEPLEAALARGARPLALLGGYGNACDAYRLTAPDPDGRGAEAAIRAALGELPPDRVGWVSAHATGTPLNDETEALALARLLPRAWVSGLKAAIGHTLGAAGALEAVITVLAVARGRLPPDSGTAESAFPDLRLLPEPLDQPVEAALSVNFAFGGHDTALLVLPWVP